MALDPSYIVPINLEEYFVNHDTGEPLANGSIEFWTDDDRTVPKDVFQLTGAPPNYTYDALPNPLNLSATGNPIDNSGNPVAIYYYPYDGSGNVELYYIVVKDSDGVIQFTREAWPNTFDNPGTTQNVSDGGTGRTSFTPYAVVCGGTTATGQLQSVAALGSAGQVLTSNGAGALPTFQTISAGAVSASQSEMETGTSTTVFTSPGRQQYHQSSAKAWVSFNGIGAVSITSSYNVTSITDNGVARFVANLTVPMSSASYTAVGGAFPFSNGTNFCYYDAIASTASAFLIQGVCPVTGPDTDSSYIAGCAYGDQ